MSFNMPAASGAGGVTDSATTEAQNKTNFANLIGFIGEMLGTDSSLRGPARSLLGIDTPQLAFTVGSSALTAALKTPAGADGTAAAPVLLSARSATLASGAVNVRKATAAVSLVVSNGSTLGQASGVDGWLYWYLLDNAGTLEIAVSGTYQGKALIGSTTAEGGAGAADSIGAIYSATARASVPLIFIEATRVNLPAAGVWSVVPVEARLSPWFEATASVLSPGNVQLAAASDLITGTNATKALTADAVRKGFVVRGTYTALPAAASLDITGLPSWMTHFEYLFANASGNGTSPWLIQIGDSGGIETTVYNGALGQAGSSSNSMTSTVGLPMNIGPTAAQTRTGKVMLDLLDATTNTWLMIYIATRQSDGYAEIATAVKSLSPGALDRMRHTTVGGVDTFDAGSYNYAYW